MNNFDRKVDSPYIFSDKVSFDIRSISEISCTLNNPFVSSCYATTVCNYNFKNRILESSLSIKLSEMFILNGDTVPPNINLLENAFLKENIKISEKIQCDTYSIDIEFKPELLENAIFENEYKVTLNCSTSDGRQFDKTEKVIFPK